jgi:hypothetical protein
MQMIFSKPGFLQKLQCYFQHLFRCQEIRVDQQAGVLASMSQATLLLLMIALMPAQLATCCADGEGCVQKDQDVWVGNLLPHLLDVRVFLGNMTASVAMFFQTPDERGLAGTAWSNDPDQRTNTWRLHT